MSTVGVAVIGCGAVARLQRRRVYPHVRAFGQVVATCDADVARARELAALLHAAYGPDHAEPITGYGDVAAALADPRVQAVDICTPHPTHAPLALQAIAAGRHVLVEKPLATNLADGRQMIEAARRAGVALAVNEQLRFAPPLRRAREMIDRGDLGKLVTVRAHRIGFLAGAWMESGWRRDAALAGGGMLLDQGPHYFHALRLIAGGVAGEITHVAALAATMRDDWQPGTEDTATVILRFESGLIGEALYCWATRTPELGAAVSAYGSSGSLDALSRDGGLIWHRVAETRDDTASSGGRRGGPRGTREVVLAQGGNDESQIECLANFLRAAAGGAAPEMSGEEGWRDLAVVDAAYRSIRSGRLEPVELL